MDCEQKLLLKLNSLVIFRNILQNRVIKKLTTLLACDKTDTANAVNCLSEFANALFLHTDNFSDYLLNAVLDDENIYVKNYCDKSKNMSMLNICLKSELEILKEISLFDGTHVKNSLNYYGWLVKWSTREHDFDAIYTDRLNNLQKVGYGIFAKYNVFTVKDGKLIPVKCPDSQKANTLCAYERERNTVYENTKALIANLPAANILLHGDAGTGKSTTVKAVANEFFTHGLRLVEIKKNGLYELPSIIDTLSTNPLKFIIFIDDLSFSSNDDDFAALKAILEGSVTGRSKNIAVYATSNRRHLVKESFTQRDGDDVHLSDTLQEIMSLSDRFGLKITFSRPDKEIFETIVRHLAELYGIDINSEELIKKAEAFALRNGGRSPRVARQFIEILKTEG